MPAQTQNGRKLPNHPLSLLEVADVAGLVNLTDDGCGSTCTACTTNVA
ncbi:FxLD family lanthipeptide [Micromonospora sp. C31]|nr:FxLD family lanthipeptide [Micromonospora sp. C31]MBQ1076794.1 FxLD family lanthipeptide [Micromonospora sp. C31]